VALQVELVSPERIIYSGPAESVIARTVGGGDIAFLAGHAPFVGALDIGVVTIRTAEAAADEVVAVHGGFVEVSSHPGPEGEPPQTHVTILSDVAELRSQIDVDRARAAKDQAEAALRDGDDTEAAAALRRATVRLTVAEGVTTH
jgi:F-type H+-transporting ATPase subunit epsilon